MVQFCVGSRPGSWNGSVGLGRSVWFGLVSGLGSGRFCAEVVLLHLFKFLVGFLGFWGALLLVLFCGAPPHRLCVTINKALL